MRGIGEADILEADLALGLGRQLQRVGRHLDLGLAVEQLEQPLGGAGRALQVAEDVGEAADGGGHHGGEEDEGGELTRGDPPGEHVAAAHPEHGDDGAEDQRDDHGSQHGPGAGAGGGGVEGGVAGRGEVPALALFLGEGLDGAHGVDRLLGLAADVGQPILGLARQAADHAAEDDDRHDDQRHHQEHEAGELGVGDDQQPDAAEREQDVAQRLGDGRADHRLHDRRVGGDARQDLAGARGLEEAGRHADDVAIDLASDAGHDPLAEPGDEVGAQEGRDGERQDDDDRGTQRVVEGLGPRLGEAAVDQVAQADAEREDGGCGDDQCDDRTRDLQLVGGKVAREPAQLAQIAALDAVAGVAVGGR